MIDFKKLGGRKFLLAVGAMVLKTFRPEIPDEVLIMAGTFIVGEAAGDVAGRASRAVKEGKEAVSAAKDVVEMPKRRGGR
jgi:hypothetical protein